MKKIGITGGIGSGKTTVARVFEQLGIPVYHADYWAKEIMNTEPLVIERLKELFGKDIYDSAGKANRKRIAELVFADKNKLNELNSIIHPAVWLHGENWLKSRSTAGPYILKEAAILFESGGNKDMDKVIMVSAPIEIRLERVMKRDNATREEVTARMANQWPDEQKIALSDFVIVNDDRQLVIPQVLEVHRVLTEKG
ncbi:MAG: Dephospho-CoA kinase [Bacteroidia bacterium]|nr:Dephospho-CoA kinase [Bacteroidia bacterium]